MQLLKMELRGFKSFADKTTLTFDKGITAIVGPNGSGKSNISDAVRWVMGEQNVRQLRGQKSEDIIFAGTEKRRPQGAAEVSLYFDNTDHSLDVDFTEVVITRRFFRSGESEFYINKRSCRLKDIHMLFADTGIGQDSMAVIGQNRVDRILNSKPEERRIIFEEVAGISRFKTRKQEGLRKIEETNRNLERIHDMMAVLEEQLTPLEDQSKRLQQFRELDSERISYEGTLTLQELRNAERLLTKAENSQSTAMEQHKTVSEELVAAEAERRKLMAVMEQEGENLRRLDEAASAAHNEFDSMKSRYEAGQQRQVELQEEAGQIAGEEEDLNLKKAEIERQREALVTQQKAKDTELMAASKGYILTEELFHQAEHKTQTAEAALQNVSTANAQREQRLFVLKRDSEDLQRRIHDTDGRCHDLNEELQRQENDAALIRKSCQALEVASQTAQQAAASTTEAAKLLQAKKQSASTELENIAKQYSRLRGTSVSLEQRIRVLEGMEQEHEGVGRAVKEILNAQQSWRSDICGVVGELCQIPSRYATALDVALGATSRFIIAKNEKAAQLAISYLKERHAGRTTFLPQDTVRGKKRTREEEEAVHEDGIIGFANELLTFDSDYEAIFFSLLGRTLIADSMATGTTVARKYGHRLRIVCLDGTQFNAGGSLTGGSMRNKEGSLISRRAMLDDLRKQLVETSAELEACKSKQNGLNAVFETAVKEVEAAEQKRQAAALEWQKASWQSSTAKKGIEQSVAAIDKLKGQLRILQESRSKLQQALIEKDKERQGWQDKPAADTAALEQTCTTARQEMENCRTAMTERQVAVATLQEQVRHVGEQLEQNAAWQEQSAADRERLGQRLTALQSRQQELKDMLAALIENIKVKEAETAEKDKAKENFYQSKADNFKQSQALDDTMQGLREQVEKWNQRLSAAAVQLEKYHGEIQRSEERLALQGLSRQEAMERRREGSLKELNEKVADLRARIAELGQINPNADEEYRNAVEKHDFFTKQCDDLLEAKEKLQAVVAEIDEAMAKQFDGAFKEISAHFQQIFTRLFGGGTAKISLTDAHDILNAGVEILIQPPGKKQQQLTLLSGGERALTVIALLFAFLAYHPAPFCLVDEVDAALDEANVERLARYLKNYSGNTQFIVITHRRKTMEAANTLQGVTMEEKGVSRLLTVKVDELLKEGT